MGSTYFENNNLRKYIEVARGQDGVDVISMIGLVLVKKGMLRYAQDVGAERRMG